jgi:hypothetical protein
MSYPTLGDAFNEALRLSQSVPDIVYVFRAVYPDGS